MASILWTDTVIDLIMLIDFVMQFFKGAYSRPRARPKRWNTM